MVAMVTKQAEKKNLVVARIFFPTLNNDPKALASRPSSMTNAGRPLDRRRERASLWVKCRPHMEGTSKTDPTYKGKKKTHGIDYNCHLPDYLFIYFLCSTSS